MSPNEIFYYVVDQMWAHDALGFGASINTGIVIEMDCGAMGGIKVVEINEEQRSVRYDIWMDIEERISVEVNATSTDIVTKWISPPVSAKARCHLMKLKLAQ